MRKAVVQLELSGCGIASVAAIARVPYSRAKQVAARLRINAQDERLWSDTAPVRRLLSEFGFEAGPPVKFRSWDALPDLALLAIKWHLVKGRPFWHWVVFVRENGRPAVLDSKKSLARNIRSDFGRMKPKWFMAIWDPENTA